MNDQIKSVSGIHGNLHLPRVWEKFWTGPGPVRYVDPWPVLEKQSLIIAKQKKLIFRLHEELEKRNLKTEEVLLVLQGVTMGLKGTRKGSSSVLKADRYESLCSPREKCDGNLF